MSMDPSLPKDNFKQDEIIINIESNNELEPNTKYKRRLSKLKTDA